MFSQRSLGEIIEISVMFGVNQVLFVSDNINMSRKQLPDA